MTSQLGGLLFNDQVNNGYKWGQLIEINMNLFHQSNIESTHPFICECHTGDIQFDRHAFIDFYWLL